MFPTTIGSRSRGWSLAVARNVVNKLPAIRSTFFFLEISNFSNLVVLGRAPFYPTLLCIYVYQKFSRVFFSLFVKEELSENGACLRSL